MNRKFFQQQSGFIASYILYGIGLLAIVGAAYARLSTNTQQGQSVQDTVNEVAVQLEVIKGKIMLCAAVYPDGDHAQFDTRHAYPAPATAGNIAVISAVACPTPNGPLSLALMPDGIPLPVSPPDFEEWVYEHTEAGGIRLRLIPRLSGGAAATRERLLRQYDGSIIANGDDRINQHDTRITSLESWRTDASKRMDGMQTAIDLNIQKIAENAVAIQTNSVAIERLDDALFTLDGQVKNNSDLINNINSRWAKNFSESADGSLLTVNAVELKVSNFTAQQLRANSVYSQRLEAEMARIADLEVNNLKANSAVANTVQAEQVNTGSAQVYAGVGLPAVLFAAKSDGHYTVSTSALDGSYATATVIVNAGQAKVVSVASEGIELYAEGNQVKVIAAGKSIKASWIKMG